MNDGEVIALVLLENDADGAAEADPVSAAHRLVRDADGRVSLEAVGSRDEFVRTARDTGCFRRGKPIRDPETLEVIGYEMEEIGALGATSGS